MHRKTLSALVDWLLGSYQQLQGGGGWNEGCVKNVGELKEGTKFVKVDRGAQHFVSYNSNMHVNTMAWHCNGGAMKIF